MNSDGSSREAWDAVMLAGFIWLIVGGLILQGLGWLVAQVSKIVGQ